MIQPVLIIYTGGTIGMQHSEQGFRPAGNLQALIEENLSNCAQQALAPYRVLEFERLIDSSNSQPSDWQSIAQCIVDNYDDYSGFVVLHGTDTMAYTAAALHHMLGECDKNVIVTGSQIPLSQLRSDGAANLLDAVLFARGTALHQVALYFANQLLCGHRASKVHSSDFSAFTSPNHAAIASCAIDIQYAAQKHSSDEDKAFKLSLAPSGSVDVLLLYPGISNSAISGVLDNPSVKAVVLLSFGAGNPADQNQHLMQALSNASKRGVVIINKTQCHQGAVAQGSYAVSSALGKLGILSGQDRTLEDLVTDLYVNLDNYQALQAS